MGKIFSSTENARSQSNPTLFKKKSVNRMLDFRHGRREYFELENITVLESLQRLRLQVH